MSRELTCCRLCPRRCGADRSRGTGQCHADAQMRIVRIAPHHWEEPCLSGTGGAGTVFFSGCSLGCIFCQNYEISRAPVGEVYTPERLAAAMRRQRLCILAGGALLVSEPDDLTLTLYHPDAALLSLVRALAAGEGLYVWQPPQEQGSENL